MIILIITLIFFWRERGVQCVCQFHYNLSTNRLLNFTKTCPQIGISIYSKERPLYMSSFCRYFFSFFEYVISYVKIRFNNLRCLEQEFLHDTNIYLYRLIKISIYQLKTLFFVTMVDITLFLN